MICDLHTHSKYSFDGIASIEELCSASSERGVEILAITDHCDLLDGPEGISAYLAVEEARAQEFFSLREHGQTPDLLWGIEIGNAIDCPQETSGFLQARSFDFVIGAIHFLPDGSDIYKLPYPDAASIDAMFRSYFDSMLQLVRLGGFDTLAHLDYPLRVLARKVPSPTVSQYREMIEPILAGLVAQNIALELNTRGTYDWQNRVGPEEWVLRRYRELGGELVTIGSDAHTTKYVGAGYQEAAELLQKTGFSAYTIYRNRKPQQITL